MKYKQLLNHTENTRKVEDEEKTKFLKYILEQMGVPVHEFWTSDEPLSIDQRIQLRGILSTYGIQVIDSLDGLFQIYVSGELVAEFYKPRYTLKRDLREIDPRKQPYVEMNIECWSLFEDAENEQTTNTEDNGK
jgi:hypothetical protein